MSDITEQAFKESEFYRKWAIAGMPADKQRLALAAWQAAQSVPGFVLVPVESARVCATLAKLHFDRVQRHFAVDDKFPLSENWQPHINALVDAVEAQEKKNG